MELEHSLPLFTRATTRTYPESGESNPHPPTIFPKTECYIVLRSMPMPSELSLSFRLTNQNFEHVAYRLLACYMSCPSHLLDLIILKISRGGYKVWDSSRCCFLRPVNSSLLGPNNFPSILFSDTRNLFPSHNV